MQIETICRYKLPTVVIVCNNGGLHRGDELNDIRPVLTRRRYDRQIEAFGGTRYHAEDSDSLATAVQRALDAGAPALGNCVIDPTSWQRDWPPGELD
jgi:oxalyl-CoA decarboxylase